MSPFPIPAGCTPGDLTTSFCDDHGGMLVRLTDEGGGYFVALKTDGDGVCLDPAEMRALGEWCVAACAEMDAAGAP